MRTRISFIPFYHFAKFLKSGHVSDNLDLLLKMLSYYILTAVVILTAISYATSNGRPSLMVLAIVLSLLMAHVVNVLSGSILSTEMFFRDLNDTKEGK